MYCLYIFIATMSCSRRADHNGRFFRRKKTLFSSFSILAKPLQLHRGVSPGERNHGGRNPACFAGSTGTPSLAGSESTRAVQLRITQADAESSSRSARHILPRSCLARAAYRCRYIAVTRFDSFGVLGECPSVHERSTQFPGLRNNPGHRACHVVSNRL
jgi:hypothetical protein